MRSRPGLAVSASRASGYSATTALALVFTLVIWTGLYETWLPSYSSSNLLRFRAGRISRLRIGDTLKVQADLEERLAAWADRPILSADAVLTTNLQACPSGTFERDEAFIHKGWYAQQWDKFDIELVRKTRQGMIDALRDLMKQSSTNVIYTPPLETTPTRGLVMTAGNARTLQWAKTSIRLLRETHGCTLPMELFYYRGELDAEKETVQLEKWNVTLREVNDSQGKGFDIKGYAFIHSTFQEFLYLDNDAVAMADPTELFDSVEYTDVQGGQAVFYADSYKNHARNPIWRILGCKCQDTWSPETGMVLFNKAGNSGLNMAILQLAYYIQQHQEIFGVLGYGDKDTWSYAAQALGLPLTMAPWMQAGIATYPPSSAKLCSHTILNFGLTPEAERYNVSYHPKPYFCHFSRLKMLINDWKKQFSDPPPSIFSYVRHLSLDKIDEPTMVRMHRGHTDWCPMNVLWGTKEVNGSFVEEDVGDGQSVMHDDVYGNEEGPWNRQLREFEDAWWKAGGL